MKSGEKTVSGLKMSSLDIISKEVFRNTQKERKFGSGKLEELKQKS